MLSIKRFREFIPQEANLSDEEVEQLRKDFYLLAQGVVSAFDARTQFEDSKTQVAFEETLSEISDAQGYELQERAGILEADAELPRADAERLALHYHERAWRN